MRVVANRAAETITVNVPSRFSSLIIELPVQQTGSGVPSPENIRPITQWADVALYVSDTDTANEPTVTTILPTPIFGGMVDVARGEVASLYNEKNSSSGWEMVEEGQFRCQVSAFNNGDETSTNVADLYSSHYKTVSNKDAYDATDDLTCGTPTIEGVTYLYVNDLDYTTLEDFTAYIGDVQFVYKSHIPMSDVIAPTIVYLPEGTSYVWAEGAYYVETVTGTPPLSLTNSVGEPLEAWSVELSPYQEGTGDPSPTNVRPIHGTDKLTIYTDSQYGGLVEWNQQIPISSRQTTTTNGITFTNNNDGSWLIDGTSETSARVQFPLNSVGASLNLTNGHKYLLDGSASDQLKVAIYGMGNASLGGSIFTYAEDANKTYRLDSSVAGVYSFDNVVIHPQLFDLTQMFGAGNEPTTVEEFRALFPNAYYAYNSGTQMTVDQVNGAQYYPVVINLPQTVYDATIRDDGADITTATVDMGTLSWRRYQFAGGVYAFFTNIPERLEWSDVMCECYPVDNERIAVAYLPDATLGCNINTTYVYIRNDAYTDEQSFVASITGKKLVYLLATQQTLTLTTPDIPTPKGNSKTWVVAEDGTLDSMQVQYTRIAEQ